MKINYDSQAKNFLTSIEFWATLPRGAIVRNYAGFRRDTVTEEEFRERPWRYDAFLTVVAAHQITDEEIVAFDARVRLGLATYEGGRDDDGEQA